MHALQVSYTDQPDTRPAGGQEDAQVSTPATEDQARLERAMNVIGSQIGELSVNIADTSGMVGDVSSSMSRQAEEFHALTRDISMIARSNQTVADASRGAIEAARTTQAGLDTTTQSVNGILVNAVSDIKSMATNATEITGVLNSVSGQIKEIHSFSESIQGIATQTQLLAVNAGIMATSCRNRTPTTRRWLPRRTGAPPKSTGNCRNSPVSARP